MLPKAYVLNTAQASLMILILKLGFSNRLLNYDRPLDKKLALLAEENFRRPNQGNVRCKCVRRIIIGG